jgi:hypothetical protein
MCRVVFNHIVTGLKAHDNYFMAKRNANDKLELSSIYKCIVAVQMFAYAVWMSTFTWVNQYFLNQCIGLQRDGGSVWRPLLERAECRGHC